MNNDSNITKKGEDLVFEPSDVIDYFRNIALPFLTEVRNKDQFRSSVGDGADGSDLASQTVTTDHTLITQEGNPATVNINVVLPELSSLPVASIADRYTRSMLKCLAGYPLYEPQPFSEHSTEYLRNGVNIGDVGFVRGDGVFEVLFNVCSSRNDSVNPPMLPSDGFSLEIQDGSATRISRALPRRACIFQSPIKRMNFGEYICEGSEGAVLELPEGAIQDGTTNIRQFAKLAALHGVRWYKYTMTRSKDISNGSLYLITSFTKCAQWGIAVFDGPCATGQGLRFDRKLSLPFRKSPSKYHWKGSRAFHTKVANYNKRDSPNQCVFLQGYKLMLRQDIYDNLCNNLSRDDQAVSSSSPSAGSGGLTQTRAQRIKSGGLFSRTMMSASSKSCDVSSLNSSPAHPSDIINATLLDQTPSAKIALTHDDIWCNLLRDNLPKLNYTSLINIAHLYTTTIEHDCISLEKMPYSSNVGHTSQGTQNSSLLVPLAGLTTPNDDYAGTVPAMVSLTLPHELVERILLLLDTKSMLTCMLINREFNEIIRSSTLLQYFLACRAAGVVDNPQSPLSYAERLEALRKREDAWRNLKPIFERMIEFDHPPSSIYGLTGGAYFLNDTNQQDLYYCHLPSSPQDSPRWIRIPGQGPGNSSGDGWPGTFVNFAIAAYEHDLIVNVVCSHTVSQADADRHSLDLVLLKFSTGEYHPLARLPQIHVQRSPSARLWVGPIIIGDNIALVVHSEDGTFLDKLFIFDWKTGHKRLQHETAENAYSDIVLISPELLLVPNLTLSHFEVWLLPSNPTPPVQILSLKIPTISRDYSLVDLSCVGEPCPFLSMPYFPPRPFFTSPEDSIISANLRVLSNPSRRRVLYTLIVHRRALLETIQPWISSSRQQLEDLPIWLTNEVIVHKTADPDDGSVRLGAQSELGSVSPHPRTRGSPTSESSQTPLTSYDIPSGFHPSSVSSGSSTSLTTSRYSFLQVKWTDWGPSISRWFQVHETQMQWIATSVGQRYAFSVPNPRDRTKLMVSVADFNPYNFRRSTEMTARLRGEGNSSRGNDNNEEGKEKEKEENLEILDHEGIFSEKVLMGLKCAVYNAPDEYDFDAVLMDEERLLGMKGNCVEKVKVLYFG